MAKLYFVGATVELPEGLGPRSAAIASMQPAIEAFRKALEKAGFAATVTEKVTEPKGPRAPKPVADAGGTED